MVLDAATSLSNLTLVLALVRPVWTMWVQQQAYVLEYYSLESLIEGGMEVGCWIGNWNGRSRGLRQEGLLETNTTETYISFANHLASMYGKDQRTYVVSRTRRVTHDNISIYCLCISI